MVRGPYASHKLPYSVDFWVLSSFHNYFLIFDPPTSEHGK